MPRLSSTPRRNCSVQDCGKLEKARGFCAMHYARMTLHGSLERPTPKRKTLEQRFWSRVNRTETCWLWTAGTLAGYGAISDGTRSQYAHRVSYEMCNGPIPGGLVIDHICHNKLCVNPAHLRAVTNKQNVENQKGLRADNTSGATGVSWCPDRRKWVAGVIHNGRYVLHQRFVSKAEAEAAALATRLKYFTTNDADRR